MVKKLIGLYPGTFDPATLGHTDIIKRAIKIVDHLVIGIVSSNDAKKQMFTLAERIDMMRHEAEALVDGRATIEVKSFDILQVKFAHEVGATVVIRGVRALSDFEYEFQMAVMNRKLSADLETVFLMPKEEYSVVSSRMVREVGGMGGDLSGLVPEPLVERIAARLRDPGQSA